MTLDLAALKTHLGADAGSASDDTLEMLLDAAREAVDEKVGPVGDTSELVSSSGSLLPLSRRAMSVVSVLECGITLDATDYALRPSGRILVRLDTGLNPRSRWSGRVDVTYTPVPDLAARESAEVSLVKLDINNRPGVTSEKIGDWAETYAAGSGEAASYAERREEILSGIHGCWVGVR